MRTANCASRSRPCVTREWGAQREVPLKGSEWKLGRGGGKGKGGGVGAGRAYLAGLSPLGLSAFSALGAGAPLAGAASGLAGAFSTLGLSTVTEPPAACTFLTAPGEAWSTLTETLWAMAPEPSSLPMPAATR